MEEVGLMKLLGFRETSRFTNRVVELIDDEDYAKLQLYLAEFPDAGNLIKGGGGIRKLRYALPGRGKSGGARIIYFGVVENGLILMLEIYAKNEQSDLSDDQVNALRKEMKGMNP